MSCGFQLQGAQPLPAVLQKPYLQINAQYQILETPLATSLRTRLLRQGGLIAKNAEQSTSILRILNISNQRILTALNRDGKAVEFQLRSQVDCDLIAPDGTVLVKPFDLTVLRDYSFNATAVLAREAEEARLSQAMQDELAALILLWLDNHLQ